MSVVQLGVVVVAAMVRYQCWLRTSLHQVQARRSSVRPERKRQIPGRASLMLVCLGPTLSEAGLGSELLWTGLCFRVVSLIRSLGLPRAGSPSELSPV